MQKSNEIVPVRIDLHASKKRGWENLIEGLIYLAVAWGTFGVFSLFTRHHDLNRWVYEWATGTWPPPSPQDFRNVFAWHMLPLMLVALMLAFAASHFLSPYRFRLRHWERRDRQKLVEEANTKLQKARLPLLFASGYDWDTTPDWYDLCKDGPVPFEEITKRRFWSLWISNGQDEHPLVKYHREHPKPERLKQGMVQPKWEVTCPDAKYDTESGLWRFEETDFIVHGPWPDK